MGFKAPASAEPRAMPTRDEAIANAGLPGGHPFRPPARMLETVVQAPEQEPSP